MDHSSDPTPESPSTSSRSSFLKRVGALGLAAGTAGAFGSPLVADAAMRTSRAADDSNALTLWTFVDTHARWFKRRATDYQKQVNPHFSLTVRQYPGTSYHQKLLTVLETGVNAPDLCDIEQGQFGIFLHGTVPLIPLEQRLQAGGYLKELVPSREALYTWKGHIYGIEHALTPVVLYYREDYFRRYGIKPTDLVTWDDFVAAGKTIRKHGIYMTPVDWAYFELLLRQRGSDIFNARGDMIADSPLAIKTLQWLMDLTFKHGVGKIPAGLGVGTPQSWAEVQKGMYATMIGADWWAGFMADFVPKLSGKWRAMPLPYWPDDKAKRRTSCWGGTGLCIPTTTSNKTLAWDFARFCLLTTAGEVQQFQMIQLYPPFTPAWKDKALHKPNAYMGGQDLGAVFAEVGRQVPPEYQSPFRPDFETFTDNDAANLYTRKTTPAAFLSSEAKRVRTKMKTG